MLSLHKSHRSFSGIVHIGCDEVFHLATCSECASRLRRLNSASSSKKRAASSVAALASGAAADSVRRRTGEAALHVFHLMNMNRLCSKTCGVDEKQNLAGGINYFS